MPEEVITPISSTSVSTSVSASTTPTALPPNSVVEILQGDELAKAIDGECEAIEGKVTLVLRESGGEEEEGKKLVFRMPKVGKLVDIIIIYHCITIVLHISIISRKLLSNTFWIFFLAVDMASVQLCLTERISTRTLLLR